MKKDRPISSFLIACLGVLALHSAAICQIQQSSYVVVVKGKVSLSYNKAPLRSVWVIISQDGKEKTRALTGDDGRFYVKLQSGSYEVSVLRGKSKLCTRQLQLSAYSQTEYYELNMKIKSLTVRRGRTPLCE